MQQSSAFYVKLCVNINSILKMIYNTKNVLRPAITLRPNKNTATNHCGNSSSMHDEGEFGCECGTSGENGGEAVSDRIKGLMGYHLLISNQNS